MRDDPTARTQKTEPLQARPPGASAREVFGAFLKLGLTSFGGPIAHLGYFREEFVVRRRWIEEADYADLVALCQFLPGPASSQVGFSLGLLRGGYLGALAAWCAFTLPSALLLVLFATAAALAFGSASRRRDPWPEGRRGRRCRAGGLRHGAKPCPRSVARSYRGRRGSDRDAPRRGRWPGRSHSGRRR